MKKSYLRIFSFVEAAMYAVALNLLFLLCSLPVLTIGASLTALYSGWRALIKKEPCLTAFFRTFRTGFVRATLVWIILMPLNALLVFNTVTIAYYREQGSVPALVLSAVFALLLLSITTMVFLFYSRFEATPLQMLRYGGTITLSHPLRAALIAVLTWMPIPIALLQPMTFLLMGMVWLFFYFSTVAVGAIWIMNRPFAAFARQALGMDIPTKTELTEDKGGQTNDF